MLNRVVLIGRITKDPELRQAGSNNCCNFTLAVNRRFAREGQQDADFINCVAWNQSANFLSQYVKKGYLLSVEGRLQTRSYDGQSGKVYVTEVVCDSVNNLTPKGASTTSYSQPSAPAQAPSMNNSFDDSFMDTPSLEISSDDLPFY